VTQSLLAETIFLASAAEEGLSTGRYATDTGSAVETRSAIDTGADPVLASRTLPWIAATPGTLCHLMAVRLCQAAGFTPRIRHYADDFAAVLTLVAAGQGVALVPELALADLPDGVTLVPLPALRRTLIACRRGAAAHPAVVAAAAAIRAAAADYLDVTATHRSASPASGRRRAQQPSSWL
jgi:hypothetical protein